MLSKKLFVKNNFIITLHVPRDQFLHFNYSKVATTFKNKYLAEIVSNNNVYLPTVLLTLGNRSENAFRLACTKLLFAGAELNDGQTF
jgi:hypothetical protein